MPGPHAQSLYSTDPCTACERLVVTVESSRPISGAEDLPNTYDAGQRSFVWKFHEFFGYALIPRSSHGKLAEIDCYLCIDEEDADDIDVHGYTGRFLREKVFQAYGHLRIVGLSQPIFDRTDELRCRKLKHFIRENDHDS